MKPLSPLKHMRMNLGHSGGLPKSHNSIHFKSAHPMQAAIQMKRKMRSGKFKQLSDEVAKPLNLGDDNIDENKDLEANFNE